MSIGPLIRAIAPLGRFVIALAFVGAFVGIAYHWIEGWFAAIAGAVLLLTALPFLLGSRAYRMAIVPQRSEVVAGGEVRAEIEVENTGGRPQLPATAELAITVERGLDSDAGGAGGPGRVGGAGGEAEDPFSSDARGERGDAGAPALHRLDVPLLGPRGRALLPVAIPAARRGVIRLGPLTLARRDPLGLLRRELVWHERHLVHVHPRTAALPPGSAGLVRDLEGQASRRLVDADLSFHAVREYAPGDAVRHVHWKTTAKTGTLMVRQFEESQTARVAVLFDARPEAYAGDDEFELGVSAAASLSVQAVREGRERFVAATRAPGRGRRGARRGAALRELPALDAGRLLDAWAELGEAPGGAPLDALSRDLAESGRPLSIVAVVTGSETELGAIRRAAVAFPPEVHVLAVRCAWLAEPRVQRIDPLTLCTVGALDDLPALLLRGAR